MLIFREKPVVVYVEAVVMKLTLSGYLCKLTAFVNLDSSVTLVTVLIVIVHVSPTSFNVVVKILCSLSF